MRRLLSVIALGLACISAPALGAGFGTLPPDRFPPAGFSDVPWQDPGGWTTIDVSTQGITPGSSTVAQDLQQLLDAIVTPTVVYLPAGNYTLTQGLSIKSNTILRGAGADATRLLLAGSAGPIQMIGGWDWVTTPVTADLPAGSNVIPVADASKLVVGDLIRVEQDLAVWAADWGKRSQGQHVLITAINGNDLTVDMPLALPYTAAGNPEVVRPELVRNSGIEKLALERTEANGENTVYIRGGYNVFVRSVESYKAAKYHIDVTESRQVIIRGNYVHHAWDYGGGGYGVLLEGKSTRCLVTDNVFETLRHHVAYHTGANHNVVSYNLDVDIGNPDNDSESDVNGHGHYPNHNLFEGNAAWWFYTDDTWGASGPENTLFRNLARGQQGSWHHGEGITVEGNSDRQNLIGNELVDGAALVLGTDVDDTFSEGNVVGGVPKWSSLPSDTTLPASLYLDCRPSFWPESEPWPPYGPDVTSHGKLPAEIRYASGSPVANEDATSAGGCGGQAGAAGVGGGSSGAGGGSSTGGANSGGAAGNGASGAAGSAGTNASKSGAPSENSGCGCSAPPRRSPPALASAAVLLALALGRRRRHGRKRGSALNRQ